MLHPLPGPSKAPLALALGRWLRGMQRAELLPDLTTGGPYTLVAPLDDAFDRLPWSFERLMNDEDLVEPCVDLFEYLVIRGAATGDGPVRKMSTLRGEPVHIGGGVVIGPGNTARIAASLRVPGFSVHVTEACVLPTVLLEAFARTSGALDMRRRRPYASE